MSITEEMVAISYEQQQLQNNVMHEEGRVRFDDWKVMQKLLWNCYMKDTSPNSATRH